LAVDPFGTDVEIIERAVNGRKIKLKWDWGKFKSTEGFPVDDNLINWVMDRNRRLMSAFYVLTSGFTS